VDLFPLFLSFEIAALATVLAGLFGVGSAALLANTRWRGRDVMDVILTAPMVLPPTVLGYAMLVLLGRRGALGHAYETLTGSPIVFTRTGAVLAASVGAYPLVVKHVRAAFEALDPTFMQAARTLGASPSRAFLTVQLPLAKRSILAALMLAFARSIGDFGVTLMVAGDIPYETRTASIAIYNALQSDRHDEALTMALVVTALVLALLYAVGKLAKSPRP
jgi:molybdate transport system permease protein